MNLVRFRSASPGPGRQARTDVAEAFTTFRPALRGQSKRVALAVVLALATTGLELLKPWPITWILDRLVSTDGPTDTQLLPIVSMAALAFAVPALLGLLAERLQLVVAMISRKATVRIRADVFEHLQRLELSRHHRHYSGDLLVRLMGDVNMIRDLLFPSWLTMLSRGSVLIGGAVVFALVEWRLFLVALIPMPLLWITVERGSTAIKTAAGRQRRKEGAIAARAAESLRHVSLIKAFAAEARTAGRFRAEARSAERATMAATKEAARMARLTEVLTGAGVALVLLLGARRTQAGLLTPGQLILAVSYTRMIYKPIRKLTGEGARMAKAAACALRVMDILDQPIEVSESGVPVAALEGDIDFVDVTHRYPDGRVSLDRLSVHIPADSITAIVGENGSGKSTMLALLLRLYRPDRGSVRLCDVDIGAYRLADYRRRIAYVPQDLGLFGGTIRENITFGNPDATEDQIVAAAEAALLTPILDHLPEGLDTMLDEDGTSLSGGEARRVMLARGAVRDGSLLLLDEPLTGLDPAARITVAAAITNIAQGRTTIVIHHGDLDELAADHIIRLGRAERSTATSTPGPASTPTTLQMVR